LTPEQEICVKCQKCCKKISIYTVYSASDRTAIEFYRTRGFSINPTTKGFINLSMDIPCPHLTESGCDIYETRPEVCRIYVGVYDPLIGEECLLKRDDTTGQNKSS
jgi:Fe-S-cluster containining protein